MSRDNFFMLLNLSIDPPEENPETIQKAIHKKQGEWSKLRNHPSRGIQAKKMIGLIPEIKKVMLSPELRSQEAAAALRILKKKQLEKFVDIDRYLSIYNSKGSVTSEEIQKLVQMYSVETEDILKWMLKKEKEKKEVPANTSQSLKKSSLPPETKMEEIHRSLMIRMRKGYICEDEIVYLAKAYVIDQNEIMKQIPYPVQAKNAPPPSDKVEPITPTIFKAIATNLKIIGKKDLYDFLSLPASSKLESLQNRALKYQQDYMKISKKDANVTAGSILSGHCITVFKSRRNRMAYDMAEAQSLLNTLNGDIDMAEFDGVIRKEYTEALIQNASSFGMSYDEAHEYINEYCRHKNWKMKSRRKQKKIFMTVSIAGTLTAVIFLAGIFLFLAMKEGRLRDEYDQVTRQADAEKRLEDRKATLSNYVQSHTKSKYTAEAQIRISMIERQIRKRNIQYQKDFDQTVAAATALMESGEYEKAQKKYQDYLAKHPAGKFVKEIRSKASGIPMLIDKRDFQTLEEAAKSPVKDRLDAARQYLSRHPKGKFAQEVKQRITKLEESYFKYLRKQIAILEKKKNWQACMDLGNQYFYYYPSGRYASQIKGEQLFYNRQIQKGKLLAELDRYVKNQKSDNRTLVQIYMDYLKTHPESPIKYVVQKRLSQAEKKQ